MVGTFVRLKLRLIRNGLRGNRFRGVGLIFGSLFAAQFAVAGFAALAVPQTSRPAQSHAAIPVLICTVLVMGWMLLPTFGFGLDETLDPARLTLLPLRRRNLMAGLAAASAIGIAPVATVLMLCGALVGYGDGVLGRLVVGAAVATEVALCLVGARAVTTGVARLLRSRKARDVTVIFLALAGATLGLAGQAVRFLAKPIAQGTASRLVQVLGWLPPGMVGRAMVQADGGHLLPAVGLLVPPLGLLALFTWWWATSLERLLTTAEVSVGPRRRVRRSLPDITRGRSAEAVPHARMLDRVARILPKDRRGAVALKDLRYLWREPSFRAQRIMTTMFAVAAIIGAVVLRDLRRPEAVLVSAGLAWWFNLNAINQFGVDRGAYWMNVVAAGDPRHDVIGKNLAVALVNAPVFVVVALALAAITGGWLYVPLALCLAVGLLGASFGLGNVSSVRLAQPMPESMTNPWAGRSGQGCGTALIMIVVLMMNFVLVSPLAALVAIGLTVWRPLLVIAAPVAILYGWVLYRLGLGIASAWLRDHQPELLEALGPRRAA